MQPDLNTPLPLFVYGSLIDPIHCAEILGRIPNAVPAVLDEYERGRSRHWYIRRREGAETHGLLLFNLDARDYAALDRYEEVPTLYIRVQVDATRHDGALVPCWVYLPTDWI